MNIERLKIMVTILEEVEAGTWVPTQTSSIPKIRQGAGVGKVRFNMQVWGRPSGEGNITTCGFYACAIGHACMDERLPELVSRGRMMVLPQLSTDSEDEYAPWTSIQRYFGISKEQARNLFDSHRYTLGSTYPHQVIDRINTLIGVHGS